MDKVIIDTSACHVQTRKPIVIQTRFRNICRKDLLCNNPALLKTGERKINDETQPTQKRLIQHTPHISRQNSKTVIRFHTLQEVADLDICIAIVTVLYLASLAEQGVRLVKKQNCAATLRRIE